MDIPSLIVAAAFVLLALTQAHAAKRVALVIGNDNYVSVSGLQKATNDANAIGATLEGIGYEVLAARDATRREMNRQLQLFVSRLEPGDEALFYFAGHGVEIDGRNYLLPTDIPAVSAGQEDFVKGEAIPVDIILERIRSRGTRISILILDACRDNPFPKNGTRSLGGSHGLTRSIAPEGTFIMYSAGVGQTALDRLSDDDADPNSVFTRSLIPLLKQPGMSLIQTARQVRRDVQKLATTISHDQRPAYYDEITGDFFFAERGEPVVKPVTPQSSANAAVQAWSAIQDTESKAVLDAFIRRFPDSLYSDFAKARIKELDQIETALVRPQSPSLVKPNARAPVLECDRLAGDPVDPEAVVQGVEDDDSIDSARAINACRAALKDYPDEKRFAFQLARAQYAAKDYISAFPALEKLAEVNYLIAQNYVGYMYDKGFGVTQDYAEAVKWYRKAASQNLPSAQNNLGFIYQHGEGVTEDYAEAVKWFRKAAEQGHPPSQYNLGHMYSNGLGVTKDYAEAVYWYRKAAIQNFAAATNNLGAMYADGLGVTKDYAEAVNWYRKAAEQNYASAQNNLGFSYHHGQGVTQDYAEAVKWYRKGADQGDPSSQHNLGHMYDNGFGVTKDYAQAVKWYRKAAEQNYDVALHDLGIMYILGRGGLAKNGKKAAELLSRSIQLGYDSSIKQMRNNARAYPKSFRIELQRILKSAGVYAGALDGDFGPATQAAIKKYAAN